MAARTDGEQFKSESYGEEVVESPSDRMMLESAVIEGAPENRRRNRSPKWAEKWCL